MEHTTDTEWVGLLYRSILSTTNSVQVYVSARFSQDSIQASSMSFWARSQEIWHIKLSPILEHLMAPITAFASQKIIECGGAMIEHIYSAIISFK